MNTTQSSIISTPTPAEFEHQKFIPTFHKGFTRIYDVIIVGGGPAGAYLGYNLAKSGIRPLILDHSYPRENIFLRTINHDLLVKFPLLQSAAKHIRFSNNLHLISPSGHKIAFNDPQPGGFAAVSRSRLDSFLLNNAIASGSIYIPEKVISISREHNLWKIRTTEREFCAHILVGADGVNSIVRKTVLKPLHKSDLALCMGYYATGNLEKSSLMKFFSHRSGYLWIHGEGERYTIGISDSISNSAGLKNDLDTFLAKECPGITTYARWSALIPRASTPDFFKQPCTGNNWILIGDAAGHVDPISGKGLQYALWSAELASQAFSASDLRLYDSLWKEEYGRDLMHYCFPKKRFYKPAFLDNITRFAQRSQSFSNIIYDLIISDRKWNTAGKRLLCQAPRILFEAAVA